MTKPDLDLYRVFYVTARIGSLSRAAKRLSVTKSSLSKDLSRLEAQLGHKLLNRSTRGVTLTDHGNALLAASGPAVESLLACPDMLDTKDQALEGVIRLTAPTDLIDHAVFDVATAFQAAHPGVRIELFSATEVVDLFEHDIDFALRIGRLADSSLVQRRVRDLEVYLMATDAYLAGAPALRTTADLRAHRVASLKTLDGPLRSALTDQVSEFAFTSNSMVTLKHYALASRGIVSLPSFFCEKELTDRDLRIVFPELRVYQGTMYLLSRPSRFVPEHAKRFKQALMEAMQ